MKTKRDASRAGGAPLSHTDRKIKRKVGFRKERFRSREGDGTKVASAFSINYLDRGGAA